MKEDQEDIVYHGCQGKDMERFTDGGRCAVTLYLVLYVGSPEKLSFPVYTTIMAGFLPNITEGKAARKSA
jgi:hypothetical protein